VTSVMQNSDSSWSCVTVVVLHTCWLAHSWPCPGCTRKKSTGCTCN